MTEVFFHIESGKITNPKAVRKAFTDLVDGNYLLKIERKKKRSLNQNSYCHGVLFPMVCEGLRQAGFNEIKDAEDAKTVCKSLFLKRNLVNHDTGEVIEFIRDTRELSTLEMSEFIEDVIHWGAEYLNIQIPYPKEQTALWESSKSEH